MDELIPVNAKSACLNNKFFDLLSEQPGPLFRIYRNGNFDHGSLARVHTQQPCIDQLHDGFMCCVGVYSQLLG